MLTGFSCLTGCSSVNTTVERCELTAVQITSKDINFERCVD